MSERDYRRGYNDAYGDAIDAVEKLKAAGIARQLSAHFDSAVTPWRHSSEAKEIKPPEFALVGVTP